MGRPNKFGVQGLCQAKSGEFYIDIRYRDRDTGQRCRHYEWLGAVLTSAAKTRARTVAGWANTGQLRTREAEGRTLADATADYLRWARTKRPRGLKLRTALITSAVEILGADRPVAHVGAGDLEHLMARRLEQLQAKWPGRDPLGFHATINRQVAVVRHAFGLFRSWGWYSAELLADLRDVELLPEKPGRVRHLSDDEERRLFEALGPDRAVVGAIAEAGILSGLRQANLVSLRKSWVDLARGVIELPMTKSGRRHIAYINDDLAALLVREIAKTPPTCDFVFVVPGSDPPRPYTGNGLRSVWRRAVAQAGIADLRFHDLRHTAATRLRESGADLDVIRDFLGHATLQMATRYAHVGDATMRASVAALKGRRR